MGCGDNKEMEEGDDVAMSEVDLVGVVVSVAEGEDEGSRRGASILTEEVDDGVGDNG